MGGGDSMKHCINVQANGSTDRVIVLLHAPALLATASVYVYSGVALDSASSPSSDLKDCAFGIRHSAHICTSSRRIVHS